MFFQVWFLADSVHSYHALTVIVVMEYSSAIIDHLSCSCRLVCCYSVQMLELIAFYKPKKHAGIGRTAAKVICKHLIITRSKCVAGKPLIFNSNAEVSRDRHSHYQRNLNIRERSNPFLSSLRSFARMLAQCYSCTCYI